jgi:hypothetical protein
MVDYGRFGFRLCENSRFVFASTAKHSKIVELTGLIGDVLSPPLRAHFVRPKPFQTA